MSEYDITFLSILRDSTPYLARYGDQLASALVHFERGHVIWVEGDSTDDTQARLRALGEALPADVTLVECTTHGPHWPSSDHPARWRQLETVWNTALSQLQSTRWAVCVESDLIWDWPTLQALLEHLEADRADVVCPLLLRDTPQTRLYFYDTNAFCKDGQHFNNYPPYHPALSCGDTLVTLDTGGGMLVTRGTWLTLARWRNRCVLHFPVQARIALDTTRCIYHP